MVIAGRRMSYTESDRSYMTFIAQKVIVTVQGNADTADAVLKSFVSAIDFSAIEKLVL